MLDIDVDKCCITHYPAEVLGRQAEPIESIDDTIRRLVEKMTEIMLKHKGIDCEFLSYRLPARLKTSKFI